MLTDAHPCNKFLRRKPEDSTQFLKMTDNAQAGGSGAGCNVPVNNQNVVIDQNAQNAATQMAQQILANTNVTLKQELVKIPDFWGEKGKDTVTPTQFMARIDECQIANDWNDTTTCLLYTSDAADE